MNWLKSLFKTESDNKLKVGDWVNSYNKGIHRIENIIDEYYDESSVLLDNKVGDKAKHRIIITKRLLNSKFKKSISYDSCSEYFISKIDNSQKTELQKFLNENPEVMKELELYKIPELITVYNTQLQIDSEEDLNQITSIIPYVESGKTFIDILNELKRLNLEHLKPKHFGNYDFQLFNYNHEYQNKKRIWRKAILTKR